MVQIGEEAVDLIVRRDHPLLEEARVTPEMLLRYDWVFPAAGHAAATRGGGELRRGRRPPLPKTVINTSSTILTLSIVKETNAIAALRATWRRSLPTNGTPLGEIPAMPIRHRIRIRPYSLITAAGRALPPSATLLYDLILSWPILEPCDLVRRGRKLRIIPVMVFFDPAEGRAMFARSVFQSVLDRMQAEDEAAALPIHPRPRIFGLSAGFAAETQAVAVRVAVEQAYADMAAYPAPPPLRAPPLAAPEIRHPTVAAAQTTSEPPPQPPALPVAADAEEVLADLGLTRRTGRSASPSAGAPSPSSTIPTDTALRPAPPRHVG